MTNVTAKIATVTFIMRAVRKRTHNLPEETPKTGKYYFCNINTYRIDFGESSINKPLNGGMDTLGNTLETENINV